MVSTKLTKSEILDVLEMSEQLKQLPKGELVGLLESQLSAEQFARALDRIVDLIFESVYMAANEEIQAKMNILKDENRYEDLLDLILGFAALEPFVFETVVPKAIEMGYEISRV